jgi:hypothetical protein
LFGSIGIAIGAGACSVTRPISAPLDAPSLRSYLAEYPAVNLQVIERAGDRYWIHAPEVRGDSLVGRRGYDLPVRPRGVALDQIVELRTGHVSLGRTAAVAGGVLAAGFVTLAVLVKDAQPID